MLRVMPSDNSCLFTAFGGALPKQIPAQQLRRMMADYIAQHSDVYSEAVLGSSPSQYCRSIQDPDRWGGGIELSILSSIFDIQICTFDVQVRVLSQITTMKYFADNYQGPKSHQLRRAEAGSLYSSILWNSLRSSGLQLLRFPAQHVNATARDGPHSLANRRRRSA